MDRSILLSLTIAITGIIILGTIPSTSYESKTLKQVKENCQGKISVEGRIIKTFHSEKGNYIGLIAQNNSEILTMLQDNLITGDRVKIKGKASRYREQCFIFPEETKVVS